MIERRLKPFGSKNPDILTNIVSQVLLAGTKKFEVEYKDGEEHICAMHGSVGFGIASLASSSPEAQELRAQLYALSKQPRTLEMDGRDYQLRGEIFHSFGEDAFRITIAPG
jgi:hypothetical protein